jgi:uncharacterized protein
MTSMPAPARRYPGPLALAIVAVCLVAFGAAAVDVPYLTGRVTDNAEILGADARTRLDDLLRAHEQATGNQIAVLTVPTLDGESIEDFSTRVFGAWKLGQKGKDNGVLVVVVPRDRRMRIEVGYGLEGLLPDAAASRIVRDVMTPRFKVGDFASGIEDGVKAIIAALTGQAPPLSLAGEPARDAAWRSAFHFQGPNLGWPVRILLGAFIFGIVGLFTILGIVTPGVGWFLYLFLIPFWAVFPLVVVGVEAAVVLVVIYLVAFPILKIVIGRTKWHERAAQELKKKGKTTIGGFVITLGAGGSSWSSAGSSGGGSSGGGGFSGGGGSSGGGGTSGSW